MSTLGLGVGAVGCRAVLCRGRSVVWESEQPRAPGESIDVALARLLARVHAGQAQPRVIAAIAPPFAQLRRIMGLPSGDDDARLVGATVRTNTNRFFIGPSTSIRVAGVARIGEWWWSAAFDAGFVEMLSATCRDAGFRLHGCIASAWALAGARASGLYRWRDGDATIELVVGASGLLSARCRYAALADVGDGSIELPPSADAIGATQTRRNDPLLLKVYGATGWARRSTRAGLMAISAAGVIACLAAPSVAARRSSEESERRLAQLRHSATSALHVSHELDSVSRALDDIGRFAGDRRSMLLLLAELARMLPDSARIDALRADSIGGTFVVVTSSPATMLAALRSGLVERPQLAGAITPDVSGGQPLHRIPFRFRFRERRAGR